MGDGTDEESKRYNVLDAIWPRVGANTALCLGQESGNSSVLSTGGKLHRRLNMEDNPRLMLSFVVDACTLNTPFVMREAGIVVRDTPKIHMEEPTEEDHALTRLGSGFHYR
jgi:hypothetical protein